MSHAIPLFMQQETSNVNLHLKASEINLSIPGLKDKYVAIVSNAFSEQECKQLIDFSESIGYGDALVNIGFGYQSREKMNDFRNHSKLSIDNEQMAHFIFNRIQSIIPNEFNNRRVVDVNERLRFLRYSSNEYFGAHYDGMYVRDNGQRSLITIMIYLNDAYKGGEFTFLHPTNEHKTHSIKPSTGMILLFEQHEVFHQGSIVLSNENENVFKYCIRSDIMYSKELIDESISDDHRRFSSHEVEKQKVYFERKNINIANMAIKSMQSKPQKQTHSMPEDTSLTAKVIHFWFRKAYKTKTCVADSMVLFPSELYEVITSYCKIIGVLDFVCDRAQIQQLAQVCETAERYEDMAEVMTELVKVQSAEFKCMCQEPSTGYHGPDFKCGNILTVDQRELLSSAFKNVVGAKRASWRTLSAPIDELEEKKEDQDAAETKKMKLSVCTQYKRFIEQELLEVCTKMTDLLENYILNKMEHCHRTDVEGRLFFQKTAGDYYRYLTEIWPDVPLYREKAKHYYETALKGAERSLAPHHPLLLGIVLNFAVYLFEIEKEKDRACVIAKTTFDNAINNLDSLQEKEYKDATLIMRLLRDNLTLWSSAEENDDNDG